MQVKEFLGISVNSF